MYKIQRQYFPIGQDVAGSTLAESGSYQRTGCRVIAIEDESGLSSAVDPTRRLTGDERLTLVGSDEAVQTFLKRYDVTPAETAT